MKKSLLLTSFLILLVLGYLYYYFTKVIPKDIKKYQEYIEKKKEDCNCQNFLYPKIQKRNGIQKSLWYQKDGERLLCQMNADHSILKMIPSENGWHFEEILYDLHCYMQETSMGHIYKIKHLRADEGLYDYEEHFFTAEKVFLNFYETTRDIASFVKRNNPEPSYLEGVADKVLLRLKNHMISFQADKFRAEISKDSDPL